ncbi:MAG: UDP-3-O-acyl-N-acetylglucosamine deacetylase [Phycisphaerales bacterium]
MIGSLDRQHTIAEAVTISGVGLFTGVPTSATLRPAPEGHGIVFVRSDLEGSPSIAARVEHVTERPRRTTLKRGETSIEMVEHCMAALAGAAIDNCVVEVDGPELPAGDGSALLFTEAIDRVGLIEQAATRNYLVVDTPVTVREGDATVAALPIDTPSLELLYVLDYGDQSPIRRQVHSATISPDEFRTSIAPARTFSTQQEAEVMRSKGLFAHLTPKDMLVLGPGGPIDNTLRFEDEPVRHKVLDLLGDIHLTGRPILGRIVAHRAGHKLNHKLARELLDHARQTEHGRAGSGHSRAITQPAMDIRSILRILPHRYPMVLIDRVLEMEPDQRAVGIKNVTINEPFFQGHYPGQPLMPGVLIVEAMCQLAALMLSQKLERIGKVGVLLSMDTVKLRKPVVPGDQLVIEVDALRTSTRYGDVQCRGFVGGDLAAEARVKFMMIDAER